MEVMSEEDVLKKDSVISVSDSINSVRLHLGHETLHSFLLFFLLFTLIGAQIALFYWKQKHYFSFLRITLLGLWTIPFFISIFMSFYRFCIFWIFFTFSTCYVLRNAWRYDVTDTSKSKTPSTVYAWFFLAYRSSYATAVVGYVFVLLEVFGFGRMATHVLNHGFNILKGLPPGSFAYFGLLLIFYGLYFGVLSRDCAELCADKLASKMGLMTSSKPSVVLPNKVFREDTCCICGGQYKSKGTTPSSKTDSITLNCGHKFHNWCIRGWTMVGKKDTCPFCMEKVTLQKFSKNPWQNPGVLWAHLLDSVRYLIVWNPVILISVQVIINFVDPA